MSVHEYLPFIVAGIATGAIYGLASMGLVLTYKTSGIFNFGHGAIATAAAFLFYYLHHDHNWNWVAAFLVAVLVAGPLLGLGMEPLAKRLAQQRPAAKIVGTVGLILLVQGLASVKYGPDTIRVPQFLPKAFDYFGFGGVNISYPQLWVTLFGVAAAVVLFALFRFSRMGLAMRAVVERSRSGRDAGDEPGSRPADLVDDRLHLRGDLRHPGAALHRAQRDQPHLPGGAGLRRCRCRRLLLHPADLRRGSDHRHLGQRRAEVRNRPRLAVRFAGQHPVPRAVPRPARSAATQAGAPGRERAAAAIAVPGAGRRAGRHRRDRLGRAGADPAGRR